jgi:hypothetical protein
MDMKSIMAMSMLSGKTDGNIFSMVIQTIMVASMAHIEKIVGKITEWFNDKLTKKINVIANEVTSRSFKDPVVVYDLSHTHDKYYVNISYTKPHKKENSSADNDNMDIKYLHALLHKFTKINNISSLRVCKDIITPNSYDAFEIKDGMYCVVKKIYVNGDNDLENFEAEIYSSTYNSSQIFLYIKTLVSEQEKDKTSDIMNELYVFNVYAPSQNTYNPNFIDPKSNKKDPLSEAKAAIASALPELHFTTTVFHSNRKQENIKGDVASSVFKKLNFFINNRKWYSEKGIPYHFTCMLSGEPGMGKTSCIKATANTTKRHLFVVNCRDIKTSKQFTHLFTNEQVTIKKDSNTQTVNIPIENRIYVLEELDILGDMLRDRRNVNYTPLPGGLSLDDFLNIFDGNIETPGRIIFLSSNYPEKLDKALTRGGRVDILAKFKPLEGKDIVEYIKFFNGEEASMQLKSRLLCYKGRWYITYADVCQILFSGYDDLYADLLAKNEEKEKDNMREPAVGLNEVEVDDSVDDISIESEQEQSWLESQNAEVKTPSFWPENRPIITKQEMENLYRSGRS